MATLDDVLRLQKEKGVLTTPTEVPAPRKQTGAAETPPTLTIALRNNTSSSSVYAYVTGLSIDHQYSVFLLQSNGATAYYPRNPDANQQPLSADCTIALGAPGTTRTVVVPRLAGARIWFSQAQPLTFKLNRGKAGVGLVEPSVTNPADPNYRVEWTFCEFTYNDFQLFANLTYVDFVSIPVALQLETTDGSPTQKVLGLPPDGLDAVCDELRRQAARQPGAGWDRLVVPAPSGGNLRVLSPNNAIILDPTLFRTYWQPYVDRVWARYGPGGAGPLTIDSQVAWGVFAGRVAADSDALVFPNTLLFPDAPGAFARPTARDIFSCSTGAFGDYPGDDRAVAVLGNLGARLSAAFNRSTLLLNARQPEGERVETYYRDPITNHYARILHALNLDGRGYAFPYDDVGPAGGAGGSDQMGAVASERPGLFTVMIGGGSAATRTRPPPKGAARRGAQMVAGLRESRLARRDLGSWGAPDDAEVVGQPDQKREETPALPLTSALKDPIAAADGTTAHPGALEKGGAAAPGTEKGALLDMARRPSAAEMTAAWARRILPAPVLGRAEALLAGIGRSPLFLRVQPVLAVALRVAVTLLSLPLKTLASRVCTTVFLVFVYLVFGPLGRGETREADQH